jgi:hypothetical protein
VLHPEEGVGTTRAGIKEVYTQIVKDLTSAAEALPLSYSGADYGRATRGAAYALLAKVNLVWAQTGDKNLSNERYEDAIAAADKVIDSGVYELEEEYLDNWNTGKRNEGKERIFATNHHVAQYPEGGRNHLAHCSFATRFNDATPHLIISDIRFYDKFDDKDQRKKGSYAKTLYNPAKGENFEFTLPRFRKYIDVLNIATTNKTLDIDRTILRYADVLLIKAEALNELKHGPDAEAYEAINQVRRRAFKHFPVTEASTDDTPSGLEYKDFQEAVRDERFFEFVYEQQRWFDLVRWRTLVETVKVIQGKEGVSLKHYRFAIPKSQRDINPEGLWQNWGWNGADDSKTGVNPYEGFE